MGALEGEQNYILMVGVRNLEYTTFAAIVHKFSVTDALTVIAAKSHSDEPTGQFQQYVPVLRGHSDMGSQLLLLPTS